mgnify:CR=1 FL=1
MNERVVLVETHGPTALLTLSRPKALNALNGEIMEQLATALQAADADPQIRAVVITGSDRAFCAGADISELDTVSIDDVLAPDGFGRRLFDMLGAYRKPLIAAVRGLAFGGGCEIALGCDIVVAGASARFGVPEVSLGLLPGGGGTQRLVHALGKAKAMRMLLTGDPISAVDALAAGLVSDVVEDDQCLAHALAVAERIARNGPIAVQMAKDAARAALEVGLSQGLAHERRNFILLFGTEDKREGVSAFLEKRRPAFIGR